MTVAINDTRCPGDGVFKGEPRFDSMCGEGIFGADTRRAIVCIRIVHYKHVEPEFNPESRRNQQMQTCDFTVKAIRGNTVAPGLRLASVLFCS